MNAPATGKRFTGLRDFLRKALAPPPDIGTAKNGTHAGLLKAMGLLVARQRRQPERRPVVRIGEREHRLATFAPGQPSRWQRRSTPLPPFVRKTRNVPLFYGIPVDGSRYDGARLRAIRSGQTAHFVG